MQKSLNKQSRIMMKVLMRNSKLVSAILVFLGLSYFFYAILSHSSTLFKKFDPQQAEILYGQSQWQQSQNVAPDKARDEWAIKNHYDGWSNFVSENKDKVDIKKVSDKILADIGKKGISDSFLYSYVGYKYINGANPSLLNPEHPPLAKYLIGFSIQTFGNEHTVGIIVAFLILLLVAVISYQLHGSYVMASLALFLTSLLSLFTDQFIHGPQLELYQLFFFLLVVHFLLMYLKSKKNRYGIGAGICFGLLLSTKTFLPFFLLFSAWIGLSFWKQWKLVVMIFGIGIVTFILTYYQYFVWGGTLRSFLGVQKYIVVFYGNASIPLLEFAGNYLRLIFTGHWKFWDTARSVSAYSEWNILWPIVFLVGLGRLKERWMQNKRTRFFICFFILYSLFVFIIPIFPRYLLLLFVPLIILI